MLTVNEKEQTLVVSGQIPTVANYRISDDTEARLLMVLSDKLYKNKILAVVREYSTNAADEHITLEIDEPIRVTFPTQLDLNFRVRDYGNGLSEKEIADIYCVMGESTKRQSAVTNGQLGLGCKAGFAYGDSFLVISYRNGVKTTYNSVKGDTVKKGTILKIAEAPMAEGERTGIEIVVPVREEHIGEFINVGRNFYRFWDRLPEFVGVDDTFKRYMETFRTTKPLFSGDGWEVRSRSDSFNRISVAVMANVAYPIDWDIMLKEFKDDEVTMSAIQFLAQSDVIMRFSGEKNELSFQLSREELEYIDVTYTSLRNKINEIVDALLAFLSSKISEADNLWEAKRIYGLYFNKEALRVDDAIDSDDRYVGDFTALGGAVKQRLQWNGIPIDSPVFSIKHFYSQKEGKMELELLESQVPALWNYSIDRYSYRYRRRRSRNATPQSEFKRDLKYVSENTGVKIIQASNRVKIVVNDLGGDLAKQRRVAQYLLVTNVVGKVGRVIFINFEHPEHFEEFNKDLNFDTVPVLFASELFDAAQKWYKENTSTAGMGRGSGEPAIRKLRYLDMENGTKDELESVSPKELLESETQVVFIPFHREHLYIKKREFEWMFATGEIAEKLAPLMREIDAGVKKVYCFTKQSRNAKWFKDAVEDGTFICIDDYLDEHLEELKNHPTWELRSIHDKLAEEDINVRFLHKAAEKVADQSGPIPSLIPFIEGVRHVGIENGLYTFVRDFDNKKKAPKEVATLVKTIKDKYPVVIEAARILMNNPNVFIDYIDLIDGAKTT